MLYQFQEVTKRTRLLFRLSAPQPSAHFLHVIHFLENSFGSAGGKHDIFMLIFKLG